METTVKIRPVRPGDEALWHVLWEAYCDFYGQALSASVTEQVWARLLDSDCAINGVVAASDTGALLGFAHYVLHPHTWSGKTLCYLEDLYVAPDARGRGVGHALIAYLLETGKQNGWGRVYWHTETSNDPARRLYDRFTQADDFVRYTVAL